MTISRRHTISQPQGLRFGGEFYRRRFSKAGVMRPVLPSSTDSARPRCSISSSPRRAPDVRPGATQGVPGYRAMIFDDDMRPAPIGTVGRLGVRGPTGCRYLADPERQREYCAMLEPDGRCLSQDDDGYFWFPGAHRRHDRIGWLQYFRRRNRGGPARTSGGARMRRHRRRRSGARPYVKACVVLKEHGPRARI